MSNTIHKRAKVGGEIGANGEFYKGGAFINTVPENPKGSAVSRKPTRKQNVAPYIWELPPTEGARAIYPQLAGIEIPVRSGGTISAFVFNEELRGVYATPEANAKRKAMIAAYNAGKRWI